MFNNKKIEKLENKIKLISKDMSKIILENSDLKNNIDSLTKTLESKSFSQDWEAYLKYKEMKSKLPGIEQMYKLKELKRLMLDRERYLEAKNTMHASLISFQTLYGNVAKSPDSIAGNIHVKGKTSPIFAYNEILSTITNLDNQIKSIFDNISKNMKKHELMELFKLYSINTQWLETK
tara:strand:+ start:20 stop:553 length:534 start_codon:yes stop_codon:yes gene_type:complete